MNNKWVPDWATHYLIERMHDASDESVYIVFYETHIDSAYLKPIDHLAHDLAIADVCSQIREKPLSERITVEHPPADQRSHYHKEISWFKCECGKRHSVYVDVYAVLRAFKVGSHIVGHAIKKLLAAGTRGAKDYKQDIAEAGQSIEAEKRSVDEWG